MTTLQMAKREKPLALDKLRKEGMTPAVVYGRKTESQAIAVKTSDFLKAWQEAGESAILTLSDGNEEHDVLIHDVQLHPVTEEPIHIDFYAVEKGQKVTVDIPLEFVGEAPVSDIGGQIIKVLHDLEVEGEPRNLPHEIQVDISVLTNLDSQITVADLKLPSGVVATADPEDIVITVSEAQEVEEETEPAEMDMADIEVEKKGKAEEEEESSEE